MINPLDICCPTCGARVYQPCSSTAHCPARVKAAEEASKAWIETLKDRAAAHADAKDDLINKPSHYCVNGIECLDVIESLQFGFNLGNALKYLWRAGRKGGSAKLVEDLKKARFYLDREIARLGKQ